MNADSPAPINPDDQRYLEWLTTLKQITAVAYSLEEDLAILEKLTNWSRTHQEDSRLTPDMCGWISKLSARSIAIAIRSLTDPAKDTYSLRPLLLEIRNNIDTVTISRWPAPCSSLPNPEAFDELVLGRHQKEEFSKTWGSTTQEKIRAIQGLIDKLPAVDAPVRKYATQEIAHALKKRDEISLEFRDLFAAGEAILEVVRDLNYKLSWSQHCKMCISLLQLFPRDA
jgi:hypothetical protein